MRIIVTGCSSGFGKLIAYGFARQGWDVLATTRSPAGLADAPANLHVMTANVAAAEGRAAIAAHVRSNWGDRLDCLVNNAGFGLNGPFEGLSEEQIRRQFDVNVFAPMLLTKDLLPALRAAKGKVINLSSVLGYTGMPLTSLYVSSKFALEGWSESLHYELQPQGVQVALVEPGGFRTDFAKNVEWPATVPGAGVYDRQLDSFRNFFATRMQSGKGANPAAVAEAVLRLAKTANMPLRTRVGADAQGLYYLRRIVPQRLVDTILRRVSRRLMGG